MIFRDRRMPTVDLNFLGTAVVLAIIGCVLIYSATYYSEPSLSTVKRQMFGLDPPDLPDDLHRPRLAGDVEAFDAGVAAGSALLVHDLPETFAHRFERAW